MSCKKDLHQGPHDEAGSSPPPYSTVDSGPASHGDLKEKESLDSTNTAQVADSTGKRVARRPKLYQRILSVILNWPVGKGFDPDGRRVGSHEASDIAPARWQTVRAPRPVKCSICSKVCTKHAPPPLRPLVNIFEYDVCSLHCPPAYHTSTAWNSAPWHALCQLSATDVEPGLTQSFPWRENLDRCFLDEIDYTTGMGSSQVYTYRRRITWGLRRDAKSVADRNLCVYVYSGDTEWLADLSRSAIADLISLETAVRIVGTTFPEKKRSSKTQLYYLKYRQSMQDRLWRIARDGKIDKPNFRRAINDHVAGHIRHPNDGSAVLSGDWVEGEVGHPAGGA